MQEICHRHGCRPRLQARLSPRFTGLGSAIGFCRHDRLTRVFWLPFAGDIKTVANGVRPNAENSLVRVELPSVSRPLHCSLELDVWPNGDGVSGA